MLASHMEAREDALIAHSKITENTGHSLHKGNPREAFIKEFLEGHLPSTVAIGTGEIIDSNSKPGDQRNQFDIIIYRKAFPKLQVGGGVDAFLVESVIATIEVKSTIDEEGLEQAIRAARNAKQLKPHVFKFIQIGYAAPSIINFVVAYKGPKKIKTVYDWLSKAHEKLFINSVSLSKERRYETPAASIDGVFILKNGFMHFDNIPDTLTPAELRNPTKNLNWVLCDSQTGTLSYLFFLIANLCIHSATFPIDTSHYLKNFDMRNFRLLP